LNGKLSTKLGGQAECQPKVWGAMAHTGPLLEPLLPNGWPRVSNREGSLPLSLAESRLLRQHIHSVEIALHRQLTRVLDRQDRLEPALETLSVDTELRVTVGTTAQCCSGWLWKLYQWMPSQERP